jgi:tetratricopeptide (TPR) repeat protein
VALKIIKLGMDTKQVIARFEAERQALALMDHANIAKVLDAGTTVTGRPYFVMELVRGIAITEYCDTNKLDTAERLRLFLAVCRAVHHAHQKGVIHRDIKPSNVLVTLHDGVPVPKIIDFGIAKATNQRLTEKTLFTEFHQFIGTPEYMSPEQAEMSGMDVDTRTDVYSLGVLLYQLLTGTTPVDAEALREAGWGDLQKLIRDRETPSMFARVSRMGPALAVVARHRKVEPGALIKELRGELDWIVMKALEKDRTRRYDSAVELAADAERYLADEPVVACPPSVLYKAKKFVHRNRMPVAAAAAVVLALVLGLGASIVGFVRANAEARRNVEINATLKDLLASLDPSQAAGLGADLPEVLATVRRVFGDDDATVAATLNGLAAQLHDGGDFEGAEKLYREALRIWRRQYGDRHANVAFALGRLGALLRDSGRVEEAEATLRAGLAAFEGLERPPTTALCDVRDELAELLDQTGRQEEAVALYRASIGALEEAGTEQRFRVLATLQRLNLALLNLGKQDGECLDVAERIYAESRALYPDESLTVVLAAISYGSLLIERGQTERAEPYIREAVGILRAQEDPPRMMHLIAIDRLFQCLRLAEDPEGRAEADAVLREAIEAARVVWGPDRLLENVAYLGSRHMEGGRFLDALDAFEEALGLAEEARIDADGRERLRDVLVLMSFAVALAPDRPAAEYVHALEALEPALEQEPEHPAYLTAQGGLFFRLGRLDDARAAFDAMPRTLFEHRGFAISMIPADRGFRALLFEAQGEHESALAELDALRAERPQRGGQLGTELARFVEEVEAVLEARLQR